MSIVRELLIAIGFAIDEGILKRTNAELEKTADAAQKASKETRTLGGTLKKALIDFGIAGAIHKIGKEMVSTIVEFQRLRAQMVTIEQDEKKAEVAFKRLSKFATSTPFQLKNVVGAFAQLRAVGLNPTNDDMRSVGDVAAGMGKDITDFAGAVVGATTGEMDRLKGFGILAKTVGNDIEFQFKGKKTKVKKDAESISKFLFDLGRTQFAGGMERQAATVGGAFSNLQDNVAKFFDEVGKAGLGDALVEIIKALTGIAGEGESAAFVLGRSLTVAVKSLTAAIKFVQEHATALMVTFGILGTLLLANQISVGVTAFGKLTAAILTADLASMKLAATQTLLGLKLLIIAGIFLILGLAIDDFFGFLDGKESVFGKFLDEAFDVQGPFDFIEALEDVRTELLLLLTVFAIMAAVAFGPVGIILGLLAVIGASAFILFEAIRSDWDLITNELETIFAGVADNISDDMKFLATSFEIAWEDALLAIDRLWEEFKGNFFKDVDRVASAFESVGAALEGSPTEIVQRLIGGGASSPAVDIQRRQAQISNSRSSNVNATIPITLNPPPGADTDSIMAEMGRKIEGVMSRVFDSSASDLEGAVD